MINIKDYNTKYLSDEARDLRAKISEHMFNIQYFQIRCNELQKEVNKLNDEYLKLLGADTKGAENGKDA